MVGRPNSPPPRAMAYFKIISKRVPYICMVGTTYCFEPGRPEKMLSKFRVNDVGMDLDVSDNDTLNGWSGGAYRATMSSLVFCILSNGWFYLLGAS